LPEEPVNAEELALREYLREWRRTTAREQGVAAFVVLHDSTLEEICRVRPKFYAELLQISGIGERKAAAFGQQILDALARFLTGERATAKTRRKSAPGLETLNLLSSGKSFQEIADVRGRQLSTVISAVADMVESGQLEFKPEWIDKTKLSVIEAACRKIGVEWLKPLKDSLPPDITYDEIRLVAARERASMKSA
jgi:ATP-dependent DNA helicase RecQ